MRLAYPAGQTIRCAVIAHLRLDNANVFRVELFAVAVWEGNPDSAFSDAPDFAHRSVSVAHHANELHAAAGEPDFHLFERHCLLPVVSLGDLVSTTVHHCGAACFRCPALDRGLRCLPRHCSHQPGLIGHRPDRKHNQPDRRHGERDY